MVSEPISTQSTKKVTSAIPTSVPSQDKTFHVPSATTTSSPITSTIPITIAPLPAKTYVGVSQP